jgi:hypothetical protein
MPMSFKWPPSYFPTKIVYALFTQCIIRPPQPPSFCLWKSINYDAHHHVTFYILTVLPVSYAQITIRHHLEYICVASHNFPYPKVPELAAWSDSYK